ncbi:hypothetical protein HY771_00960, partial [Candidatus Uhrbacteria bacterium]|nr:hypothetical protein [Candidatus Uhrbacteria bacterium]
YVDKELKKVERSGMLPAGLVLTGAGAKLPGMLDSAKTTLRLPVSLGTAIGVTSVIDRSNDPGLSTAIGLVLWGYHIRGAGGNGGVGKIFRSFGGNFGKITGGLKKLFKSIRP